MKLFCLPYAGGSEVIYYKWKKCLNSDIELFPIELKGRGKRHDEGFYSNIEEAVNDIFDQIVKKIDNSEYAIYGHSMGSLLAYELYYKIVEKDKPKPKHIFFSGYKAPDTREEVEISYNLPDHDFMKKIIDKGGTPEELINSKELLNIFLPIIRSDIKMLEQFKYIQRQNKIECDISVLNGKKDKIKMPEILAWKNHTSGAFKVYNLEGNHFFINDNVINITNIIRNTLIGI